MQESRLMQKQRNRENCYLVLKDLHLRLLQFSLLQRETWQLRRDYKMQTSLLMLSQDIERTLRNNLTMQHNSGSRNMGSHQAWLRQWVAVDTELTLPTKGVA